MVHACDPSREGEGGRSGVQVHIEFKAILTYLRPCQKQKLSWSDCASRTQLVMGFDSVREFMDGVTDGCVQKFPTITTVKAS